MRGKCIVIIYVIAALCPPGATARGIDGIIGALENAPGYRADVTYEVTMPTFSDPVVYDLRLAQTPAPTDSLSPCDYLIEWTLHTPGGETSAGWSAYFDGHHYRYRDGRLQEYHTEWDSKPFGVGMSGGVKSGVQRNAQFAELLPSSLAATLRDMTVDSTFTYAYYPDTLVGGERRQAVKALQRYRGYDTREWLLIADRITGMPLTLRIDNNPGSISEQNVTVAYRRLPDEPLALSDEALSARYPEEFEKFRESYFKIENLPGQPLPAFSAPTITGERYTRAKGDRMRVPTVVALLDAKVGNPADVVAMLRSAVESLPSDADIVWAFTSSNADDIERLLGESRVGERRLMSCRALARSCGVATPPAVILVGSDGVVADVIIGFNNQLTQDVIQKMALVH